MSINTPTTSHPSAYAGFSIIEMVLTTAITAIVFIIVSDLVINGMNTQRYISEQNDAIVESRKALEVMSSELREAVSADTGGYAIESAAPQEIIFYSDVDSDTYTEKVRYFLDGTQLQRGTTEPTGDPLEYLSSNEKIETLSQYIQNGTDPIFYFYNSEYPADTTNNPLTQPVNPTNVTMVEIHVQTNVDPNRIPDTRELDTFIQLRNLKDTY